MRDVDAAESGAKEIPDGHGLVVRDEIGVSANAAPGNELVARQHVRVYHVVDKCRVHFDVVSPELDLDLAGKAGFDNYGPGLNVPRSKDCFIVF